MIGRSKWMMMGAAAVLALGCGDGTTGGTGDGGTGGDTGTGGTPQTYNYAITSLTIDENSSAMMPHTGFNLDGRFSPSMMSARMPADCDHGDFYSSLDQDQNGDANGMPCAMGATGCRGGVDNQLPELAGAAMMLADLRMLIREQVSTGNLALIVRVSDVNSLQNDSSVQINLIPARPMFANCANIGMANQMYALDSGNPLYMGGTGVQFMGSIVNGRLRTAGMGTLNLSFPVMGMNINLPLSNANMRVSLTENEGTGGNLGGTVLRSTILSALTSIPAAMPFRAVIESLINGLVDVQTMGSCDAPNGGIGMGLAFRLHKAQVAAMPVMGAQAGMCGSGGGGDAGR